MLLSNIKTGLLGIGVQQFKIFILLGISLVSCNFKQNSLLIQDIEPQKSEKIIQVKGTVKKVVPLIGSGSYQLQDDTGNIWVITSSSLPIVGTEITIKGKVQQKDITIAKEKVNQLYLIELEKLPTASEVE